MLSKNRRGKLFGRRVLILGILKSILLISLTVRLYWLQVVKSDKYKTFSDSNRIRMFLLPPLRGKILDRDNRPIAVNKNFYRVLYAPSTSSKPEEVIKKLVAILDIRDEYVDIMMKKIKQHKSLSSLLLYEHLSWQQVANVEVNSPDLPGISIDVGQKRYFPMGQDSPHFVGYLGPVNEAEIKRNPLLNHPDFKIGRTGIEKIYETSLRGKAGVKKMEVNAFGLPVSELSKENSIQGRDLKLSIDKRLQKFVSNRLKGQTGSAVVMDIKTGEILSLTSSPGFDPNKFTFHMSNDDWNDLRDNPEKPLTNKAIESHYSPGSTFKLIVTLAALNQGFDPQTLIKCTGSYKLGRSTFHCWKEHGHGKLNLTEAIQHSCNTYFYAMSKNLDIDVIAQMAKKFGLGEKVGINLPGEQVGLVPTKKWKKNKYQISWQKGDTLNVGIGQGYLLTTPIQLLVMTARVASGKEVKPSLVLNTNENQVPDFAVLKVPKAHLDLVREGMRRVINQRGGTAYGSRLRSKEFSIAGKTGTTQVISKKNKKKFFDFMTKAEQRKTKNHALFVGYGPVENPRYATVVVIEHGGGGSASAAPVARDILDRVILKQNIS